jgi:acid phosphatase type 7
MKEQNSLKINRRRFMTSVGLVGAISAINPLTAFSETIKITEATAGTMKCKPYLQAAQTDGITVRWITQFPCHSWVEYGETRGNLNHKAQEVQEGLVLVDNRIHAIPLTNLSPGKTYYYRAASRETGSVERKRQSFGEAVYSEVYSFTTLSKEIESV